MKVPFAPSLSLDVENKYQHIFANSGLYNSSVLNIFSQNPTLYMLTFGFILTIIIIAMILVNLFLTQIQQNGRQLREVQYRLCSGPFRDGEPQA